MSQWFGANPEELPMKSHFRMLARYNAWANSRVYAHAAALPDMVLPQQRREVSRLASQAGVRTEPMIGGPGDRRLAAVTGAHPPTGSAISRADYDRVIAPRSTRRTRPDRPRTDRRGRGPHRERASGRRASSSGVFGRRTERGGLAGEGSGPPAGRAG